MISQKSECADEMSELVDCEMMLDRSERSEPEYTFTTFGRTFGFYPTREKEAEEERWQDVADYINDPLYNEVIVNNKLTLMSKPLISPLGTIFFIGVEHVDTYWFDNNLYRLKNGKILKSVTCFKKFAMHKPCQLYFYREKLFVKNHGRICHIVVDPESEEDEYFGRTFFQSSYTPVVDPTRPDTLLYLSQNHRVFHPDKIRLERLDVNLKVLFFEKGGRNCSYCHSSIHVDPSGLIFTAHNNKLYVTSPDFEKREIVKVKNIFTTGSGLIFFIETLEDGRTVASTSKKTCPENTTKLKK